MLVNIQELPIYLCLTYRKNRVLSPVYMLVNFGALFRNQEVAFARKLVIRRRGRRRKKLLDDLKTLWTGVADLRLYITTVQDG